MKRRDFLKGMLGALAAPFAAKVAVDAEQAPIEVEAVEAPKPVASFETWDGSYRLYEGAPFAHNDGKPVYLASDGSITFDNQPMNTIIGIAIDKNTLMVGGHITAKK